VYWIDQLTFDALLAHDLEVRDRLRARLAYHAELAEMPLFRDLSATELELLVARFSPLSFEEGSTIIRQGARGQRFYVVRSGAVEVWRNDERLARLGPGEAFGEIALLLDIPRTASVMAVEPTLLLALEAEDFRDLLASYLGRADELQLLTRTRLRSHM
jgi:CRP-like cAMP-binding protein